MTAEGWAWLWLGGVYLVWTGIFVGVVILALRSDTNIEIDGGDGRGSDREPSRHPRSPRGRSPRSGRASASGRLRGAEGLAKVRRRRRERVKPHS
jgi:hypothetical protein